MNKDQSLALYHQGKDSWNAWATDLLARQKDSDEWKKESSANFSFHVFGNAEFSGFIFPGLTDFSGTVFSGNSWFIGTKFEAEAKFKQAVFKNEICFIKTDFGQDTWFEKASFEGDAHFGKSTFRSSADFRRTSHKGTTNFNNSSFRDIVFFGGAVFHNYAMFHSISCKGIDSYFDASFKDGATFQNACFSGNAHYSKAKFEDQSFFMHAHFGGDASFGSFGGAARFESAIFDGEAWFARAVFEQMARFNNAFFKGGARFEYCTFKGDAAFSAARFGRYAIFDHTKYRGRVSFQAVEARSAFTMANAFFSDVPNFDQATFVEAPRLDNFDIQARNENGLFRAALSNAFKGNSSADAGEKWQELKRQRRELGVRWRTLKRLATQGHDHQRELYFFREEMLTSRWITDKPWHTFFWFGVLYQLLSDFGRSVSRPLVCWLIWLLAFWALYLVVRPDVDGMDMPRSCSRFEFVEPWVAALTLSTHRSLPAFSGLGERVPSFYSSLYGISDGCVALVPSAVSFLGVVQTVGSTALLFFLLLALRNRFRIR